MSKTNYVDREEASKILKVSTRTLDRYTRKFKMKTRKDGRRVLIKRVDLDKIISNNIGKLVDQKKENMASIDAKIKTPETKNAIDSTQNQREAKLVVKDMKVKEIKEKANKAAIEQQIYKDLYLEIKKDLKQKQERLEAATYRVGQLEAQAKHMVPLLDFNKKDRALQEAYTALDQKKKHADDTIQNMEEQVRSERMAKWIYLSLVGLLLVAEPILFLLWAFK